MSFIYNERGLKDTRISVVIRCLNEAAHLPRLLESISRQTLKPVEVIVVDSGSTDRTIEIARNGGARVVQISPTEFSFGRAINFGARVATGDILVMASAHTYPVDDGWLENLMTPFTDSTVALVYGGQDGDHRSKYSERQLFKQWFPEQDCSDQKHTFCNNANSAVRRTVWASLPYDEEIPALEDIEWAKRAIDRGHKVAYVAKAAIVHVHEEPYGKIYRRYRREAMGLRRIYPWERMSLIQAISLGLSAMISDIKHAAADGVLGSKVGSILMFRSAQYFGTYRGMNEHGGLNSDLRARLYYPRGYQTPPNSPPQRGGVDASASASGRGGRP